MIDIKEIKHFIGTNLNVVTNSGTTTLEIALFNPMVGAFKPIVRPITDLGKVIEHSFKGRFKPMIKLITMLTFPYDCIICDTNEDEIKAHFRIKESFVVLEYNFSSKGFLFFVNDRYEKVPFEVYQKLFEWHFDVFGWLDKGLAINYNEFNKKNETP